MNIRKVRTLAPWVIFLALGVAMFGCHRDDAVGPIDTTEDEYLQRQATQSDSLKGFSESDEVTIDDNGMQSPEYEGFVKSVIEPIRWGRKINHISRSTNIDRMGDSVAIVTITKTITGEFWIGIRLGTDTTRIDSIIKKPFTETLARKVRFHRVARTPRPENNWIPVALTMSLGNTTSHNNQFSISSLEFSGRYDTVITDPLNTWFRFGLARGGVPVQRVNDPLTIRVTVISTHDSSEIVVLRHGIVGGRLERGRLLMRLVSETQEGGSYIRIYERTVSARLPVGVLMARLSTVVDVFSRETIFDGDAPYENEFWGMPCVIVR
jgi:hypothetical protein